VRERAAELGREPQEDELEPMTWAILQLAEGLTALDHLRARRSMVRAAQALGRSMKELDLVLTPALAEDPPPMGTLTFRANGSDLNRWNARGYGFAPYATPANLAGQPAAVCPVQVGQSGLPLAVQLTGRPGDDLLVLQVARELEVTLDWPKVLQGSAVYA